MRVVVLYHPRSDHAGVIEDYARDYKKIKNRELEFISLDSVEGADMARLYDVVRYPAILAIANDGSLQKLWQGLPLPLMSEIDAYTLDTEMTFAQAQMLSI
ncbi:MAG TPA: hypothetical protein VFB03_03005 [Candidatus Saccharimonadales bacterium]|nr:hypothetical protein [Candidatus Saccharimonadales bacterium]